MKLSERVRELIASTAFVTMKLAFAQNFFRLRLINVKLLASLKIELPEVSRYRSEVKQQRSTKLGSLAVDCGDLGGLRDRWCRCEKRAHIRFNRCSPRKKVRRRKRMEVQPMLKLL